MIPKYSVGDRVVILSNPKEYGNKYKDECGEVLKTFYLKEKGGYFFGVKLDNYTNRRSDWGVYWFATKSIKLENEREEIKMFNNFNVAVVEFIDNPKTGVYAYALYDEGINPEDLVVVNTGHHGFAIAKVVSIFTDDKSRKEVKYNREVVCRVDLNAFNARKDAIKRAVELKRDMEKRIREAQELALYEALAEKDPTLKGMLDEYKILMESCK